MEQGSIYDGSATETKTIAAVVVNDFGHILPYTVQGTVEQCEEKAIERWGEPTWNRIKELGGKVVSCEIVLRN